MIKFVSKLPERINVMKNGNQICQMYGNSTGETGWIAFNIGSGIASTDMRAIADKLDELNGVSDEKV